MTSLEFIEKQIKNSKELLQRLEKLKVNSNKYELQLNEVLEKDTQEKLFYLQQIKAELEAWEVIEKEFGCPLKVVIEALDKGIIINEEGYVNDAYENEEFNAEEDSYYNCLKLYKAEDDYYFADIEHPYGDSSCGDIGCWVKLSDYQKTWWLKEEKNDN